MKTVALLLLSLITTSCIESQNRTNDTARVGDPCESCEAIYEYGDKYLNAVDTIQSFRKLGTPIKVSGRVLKKDGKTPVSDVILYIYHTDDKGIYPKSSSPRGWERQHGYLRTWLKTDKDGNYTLYTSRPASYPNSSVPQHIHITVKEPNLNEYYVEDFYFADDPNITRNILNRTNARGGSGVIQLKQNGDLWEAERDIILGLNIPNYPN
ncbi:intradiol ring-cleavage dioxygenase [Winogradskyella sp. 3972H.M.0a.05]|uniref:dioxygenase family protein n=1 Tax=Winogradskyella sp. 3972H.M.0a.05 TaxID=2950277 RepID=UPI003393EF35